MERIGELQEEKKIDDKAEIFESQRNLIVRRGDELKAPQKPVEKEMKNYSSAFHQII